MMDLRERIHGFAPPDDSREEILVQLYTLRKWAEDAESLQIERDFYKTQAEVAWKAYDMGGWIKIEKMLDNLGYNNAT
jgi:hypothetical protein